MPSHSTDVRCADASAARHRRVRLSSQTCAGSRSRFPHISMPSIPTPSPHRLSSNADQDLFRDRRDHHAVRGGCGATALDRGGVRLCRGDLLDVFIASGGRDAADAASAVERGLPGQSLAAVVAGARSLLRWDAPAMASCMGHRGRSRGGHAAYLRQLSIVELMVYRHLVEPTGSDSNSCPSS